MKSSRRKVPWYIYRKDFNVYSGWWTTATTKKRLQTSRRFWKRAMKFRASTYPTLDARREEARGIYDAFLSVDSPDQAGFYASFPVLFVHALKADADGNKPLPTQMFPNYEVFVGTNSFEICSCRRRCVCLSFFFSFFFHSV